MADDQPDDEPSEYDVDSLRVTREEAREVLDQQSEAISEIHDKGVHVLRLNVLVLGVVLTLASVLAGSETTPGVERIANAFVTAGVLTSVASMVTAVWAYSSTSFRTGAGASDIRAFLRRSPPEGEWLAALLYSYAVWMEQNERVTRRNAAVLFVSHVFLFLSMGYYAGSIVVGLYLANISWLLSALLVVCYGGAIGAVLVVPYRVFGRSPVDYVWDVRNFM